MRFGPLGIWEIIVIVGVALLVFGPAQLPKIARGVGKAFKSVKDMKEEITGVVLDDEAPERPQSERTKPRERASDAAAGAPSEPPVDTAGKPSAEPSTGASGDTTAPDASKVPEAG